MLADITKVAAARSQKKQASWSPLAIEAVRRIDLIFDAERAINGLAADKRLELRRTHIAPLAESYFILKTYPQCRNISIDYGIMEKADNVYVLISDFGWSDIGTWGSLYEHKKKDESGNSISGSNVYPYKLQNCIVRFPEDKIVILEGLRNYIVVESDNMLLVCRKQQEQNIKQFLNEVMLKKGDEFL